MSGSVRRHQPPQFLEPGSKVIAGHAGLPADKVMIFMSFRELRRAKAHPLVRNADRSQGGSINRHQPLQLFVPVLNDHDLIG